LPRSIAGRSRRAALERVDRRRLEYLTGVISALRPGRTDSVLASQVPVVERRAVFDGVLAELVGLRVSS
jgi:hypothetical protein